jgi:hypothetical protein
MRGALWFDTAIGPRYLCRTAGSPSGAQPMPWQWFGADDRQSFGSIRSSPTGPAKGTPPVNVNETLANQPIRNKLYVSYFSGFVIALLFGSLVIYFFMRTTIRTSIENEWKASTTTIPNMVQTSATVSLKNDLRAVVEKNREIVENFYHQYRDGRISENEAKRRARDVLLNQRIGKSGCIYFAVVPAGFRSRWRVRPSSPLPLPKNSDRGGHRYCRSS